MQISSKNFQNLHIELHEGTAMFTILTHNKNLFFKL